MTYEVYLVGGAVRDISLGVTPKDYDFVVVGSSPDEMLSQGFKVVGADFPVFLDKYGNEFALARTECKVSSGHKGFTCEWEGVTLVEDLSRRDLTINSMACNFDYQHYLATGEVKATGGLVDPFGGWYDLDCKVLRHTTNYFRDDPLRVLRVARFLSRYSKEWQIHHSTKTLMDEIYHSGELLNLTPERVWLETEKALGETTPSLYFNTLKGYDHLFLDINNGYKTPQKLAHHPECFVGVHQELVVDYAANSWNDKEINLSCILHDLGKPPCWLRYGNALGHEVEGLPYITNFCDKWKVPNSYRELAMMVCQFHTKVHGCLGRSNNQSMRAKSIMKLFEDTGALKRPERFIKMLKACEADAKGRGSNSEKVLKFENAPYPQRQYLTDCLNAVLGFDTKTISHKMLAEGKSGVIIGNTIRQERIKLIRGVQNKWKQLTD